MILLHVKGFGVRKSKMIQWDCGVKSLTELYKEKYYENSIDLIMRFFP
jgi:hypothetical protein